VSALRTRTTVVAALLLAALTFTFVGAQSHSHDSLGDAGAHADLPAFSPGHAQPDQTLHIERAAHLETSPCVACLLRQRQRAAASLDRTSGDAKPRVFALAFAVAPRPTPGAHRLPATRGPPQA
jgi:hypothetical protein